ncbi:hypothetical protein FV229_03800 [Methylobacterium sp. WL120]|nr:hypothetical protein FV229_03800 [Methylobacterium sp. WL120]
MAAGVIGGLAAGALLGAAVAEAHEAPSYGYGYGRPAPNYGAPPAVAYRPARVVREYDYEEAPAYRAPPPARFYGGGSEGYGYRNAGYGFRHAGYGYERDCDRPHGYRGW